MAAFSTFGQDRLIKARVTIPLYGLWVADIEAAVGTTFATTAALTIGDLAMTGTVIRVAQFAGTRSARVVGGLGGWLKTIPAKAYQNPNGVTLQMVLGDAAIECGEKLKLASNQVIGSFFVRENAPATRVLRQLAGPLWWVDTTGTTQVAPARSNTNPIQSPFEVIHWSGGKGKFDVASENLSDWAPGRTFTSPLIPAPQTVSLVVVTSGNEGTLRLDVLSSP